jgi:hypothetical protein
MIDQTRVVPRRLWILWFQGLSSAPFLVRKCVDSWIRENPGWDIEILDGESVGRHIEPLLPPEIERRLGPTKRSNLVRLQLLARYGGVWADATTVCVRPLDGWIEPAARSGFFAFSRPGPDRLLSTWFLASRPGGPIPSKLAEAYAAFFRDHPRIVEGRKRKKLYKRLKKHLNANGRRARWWLSPLVTRVAGIYPYFIFHYLFERLVSRDPACAAVWAATPKISAVPAHAVQDAGPAAPLTASRKTAIDARRTPVYKLRREEDLEGYGPSALLHYLLEGRHERRSFTSSPVEPSWPGTDGSEPALPGTDRERSTHRRT